MNRKSFFDKIRHAPFPGRLTASQVRGINGILDAFVTHGDGRAKTLAYALATAYHEVGGRMVPVREGFASTDAKARAVCRNRKYGKPAGPYGHVYYGRGIVQLTWLDGYRRSSEDAGCDLVKDPDKALDPTISARLLIKGLIDGRWNGRGKGIGHYLTVHSNDLKGARRTVNITDQWEKIGGYYKQFLSAIRLSGGVPQAAPEPPVEIETVPEDENMKRAEIVMGVVQTGPGTARKPLIWRLWKMFVWAMKGAK